MLVKILENPGAGENVLDLSGDFNCFKSPNNGQSCGPPNGMFHSILNDELLVQPPGATLGAAIMARVVQSWLGSPW